MPESEITDPSLYFDGFSKNLITPHPIRYGWIASHIAYELSDGAGIEHGTTIYGVTVAEWNDGNPKIATNLSGSFRDPQDAEEYIVWLKKGGYLNIDKPVKDYDDEPYAGLYGIDLDN